MRIASPEKTPADYALLQVLERVNALEPGWMDPYELAGYEHAVVDVIKILHIMLGIQK